MKKINKWRTFLWKGRCKKAHRIFRSAATEYFIYSTWQSKKTLGTFLAFDWIEYYVVGSEPSPNEQCNLAVGAPQSQFWWSKYKDTNLLAEKNMQHRLTSFICLCKREVIKSIFISGHIRFFVSAALFVSTTCFRIHRYFVAILLRTAKKSTCRDNCVM